MKLLRMSCFIIHGVTKFKGNSWVSFIWQRQ